MGAADFMSGQLFIVAAPSGAGKTSLVKALTGAMSGIQVSVSYCTRAMRSGEQEGVDYHFVDQATFQNMVEAEEFLEYAHVFDRSYGTSRAKVVELLSQGIDVILEIDWQGARQVRELVDGVVSIFVLPPSRDALQERLQGRGQDSDEIIARRMKDAVSEMLHYDEFDYVIINNDFDEALQELSSVVVASRVACVSAKKKHAKLINDLLV